MRQLQNQRHHHHPNLHETTQQGRDTAQGSFLLHLNKRLVQAVTLEISQKNLTRLECIWMLAKIELSIGKNIIANENSDAWRNLPDSILVFTYRDPLQLPMNEIRRWAKRILIANPAMNELYYYLAQRVCVAFQLNVEFL